MELKKKLVLTIAIMGLGIVSSQAQTETVATINGKKITFNPNNESWYNVETGKTATANNQSIYQMAPALGIGTATPHAQLQLGNTVADRKIVLYEDANNDNQFYGIGVQSGFLKFQGPAFTFSSSTSATASKELMRVTSSGVTIPGKTTTNTAQISNGTDGVAPSKGAIATALDTNGNVVWQLPSVAAPVGTAFFKYTASGTDFIGRSGKINFDKEEVDVSNATGGAKLISAATGYSVFTAPKSGYYQLSTCVYQFSKNVGSYLEIYNSKVIVFNESTGVSIGSVENYAYTSNPYYWGNQVVTGIYKLKTGDKISVSFQNDFISDAGVNQMTSIAGTLTYFTGYFISE